MKSAELLPSFIYVIEKQCTKAMHLPAEVKVQQVAKWEDFTELERGRVSGIGAFIFHISDGRLGYVFWQYSDDGKLSFPDVEICDFVDFKFPEGVVWERAAEEMNEADLSTRAVA